MMPNARCAVKMLNLGVNSLLLRPGAKAANLTDGGKPCYRRSGRSDIFQDKQRLPALIQPSGLFAAAA